MGLRIRKLPILKTMVGSYIGMKYHDINEPYKVEDVRFAMFLVKKVIKHICAYAKKVSRLTVCYSFYIMCILLLPPEKKPDLSHGP